jgi:hypothetical protein
MKKEIWKDIDGYEYMYQVSNLGNIRSLDRYLETSNGKCVFKRGQLIKKCNHTGGYHLVMLHNNGITKNKFVHRLVAESFLDNKSGKRCVNHLNGNKKDNRVSNLEWVSHKENSIHAFKNDLNVSGSRHPNSVLVEDDVKKIRIMLDMSLSESKIASYFNVNRVTINRIRNKTSWKKVI